MATERQLAFINDIRENGVTDDGKPTFLKDWQPLDFLGRGAYGEVYLIRKGIEMCAVKIIDMNRDDIDYSVEISALERIRGQKHAINIYESEYVNVDRDRYVQRFLLIRLNALKNLPKKMTEEQVVDMGIQLCDILSACHDGETKIYHCDIKPDNILISAQNEYILSDFGAAKISERSRNTSGHAGTPLYMSPEMLKYEGFDCRSDLYSLGITMYALLNNGLVPFASSNDDKSAIRLRLEGKQIPAASGISAGLLQILRKMCAFEPDNRYSNAGELKDALSALRTQLAETEEKRRAAEEQAKRKAAEEQAKRKAAEEEAKRRAAEEEKKRRIEDTYNLGVKYYKGSGVSQDKTKAAKLFWEAAALGSAQAMNNLGMMYDEGDGVRQDKAKAMSLYEKAAASGSAEAMYNLGIMYDDGDGVRQDKAKAMALFRQAAKLRDPNAVDDTDEMYDSGDSDLSQTQDGGQQNSVYGRTVMRGGGGTAGNSDIDKTVPSGAAKVPQSRNVPVYMVPAYDPEEDMPRNAKQFLRKYKELPEYMNLEIAIKWCVIILYVFSAIFTLSCSLAGLWGVLLASPALILTIWLSIGYSQSSAVVLLVLSLIYSVFIYIVCFIMMDDIFFSIAAIGFFTIFTIASAFAVYYTYKANTAFKRFRYNALNLQ